MNIHNIIQRLKEKGFTPWNLETHNELYHKVCESNFKIWRNEKRVIVLKNFPSKTYFANWEDDQISISYIYDILEPKFKNNLYFLLVLDWEVQLNSSLSQLINIVEKNELICRKYIMSIDYDLERVPFLQEHTFSNNELFNYEKTFRQQLHNQDTHNIIHEMINHYFSDEYLPENKDARKQKVYQLISKE
ncbi:hypothetical protein CON48_19825 [Bacillus thuringiensis]|uniref:ABC-three component system middle component 1 n=1 Tax=Bacillus cereus group TaxID=86661 RepID=UPI000BEC463C|nr:MULTISPECIES: ABC-three component system middle component 1 [Bacillus cereus group]MRC18379.1 hypothetical protein [Bacillus thuringiensis]PEA48710.1 hypothetical protein CON48_19825 [Bacillus thuringiensis]PES89568.1 hypothetical protein CN511_02440 [Bacillus thuringiensis]PEZ71059.1 hypothetical protein CN371_16615 [Bacillus thuringiensis]PFD97611.1 hypothetical protein CN303_31510 [Bacillus thuringiensis]